MVQRMSRELQRVCRGRLRENNWVKVAGVGLKAESLQQNLQNKKVGREYTSLQTFIIKYVEQFSVPIFVAISGNLGGKVSVLDGVLFSPQKKIILLPRSMETA